MHVPAELEQGFAISFVSRDVAVDLLLPEPCIRLGLYGAEAAIMAMPEATVDKNDL